MARTIVFSKHAFERMFARGISPDEVRAVAEAGETIREYSDDKPFPSRLVLGFVAERPIHVVVATDASMDACHVITVYEPDPAVWEADCKTKRRSP